MVVQLRACGSLCKRAQRPRRHGHLELRPLVKVGREDREGDREAEGDEEHGHEPIEKVVKHSAEADEEDADAPVEGEELDETKEEGDCSDTRDGAERVEEPGDLSRVTKGDIGVSATEGGADVSVTKVIRRGENWPRHLAVISKLAWEEIARRVE